MQNGLENKMLLNLELQENQNFLFALKENLLVILRQERHGQERSLSQVKFFIMKMEKLKNWI
jgi:hypothetical protein